MEGGKREGKEEIVSIYVSSTFLPLLLVIRNISEMGNISYLTL